MTNVLRHTLTGALVALFVGTVALQLLLPLFSAEFGGTYHETKNLVTPYAVAGIVSILCVQCAVIVGLTIIYAERRHPGIDSRLPSRLLSIAVILAGAFAIPAATMLHLLVIVGVGGPGIILLLFAEVVIGTSVVGLTAAASQAARSALAAQRELDGVI